jgi:hypothetical protein
MYGKGYVVYSFWLRYNVLQFTVRNIGMAYWYAYQFVVAQRARRMYGYLGR